MLGSSSSGVEARANAAIDIALCECRNGGLGPLTVAATLTRPFLRTGDAWGQETSQPIYQLLGGAWREAVQVYATCLGGGQGSDWAHTVRMETLVGGESPNPAPKPAP